MNFEKKNVKYSKTSRIYLAEFETYIRLFNVLHYVIKAYQNNNGFPKKKKHKNSTYIPRPSSARLERTRLYCTRSEWTAGGNKKRETRIRDAFPSNSSTYCFGFHPLLLRRRRDLRPSLYRSRRGTGPETMNSDCFVREKRVRSTRLFVYEGRVFVPLPASPITGSFYRRVTGSHPFTRHIFITRADPR